MNHNDPHIIFLTFAVFIFSLAISGPEYVQCNHALPDEMLDHSVLLSQQAKGLWALVLYFTIHHLLWLPAGLPYQGLPRFRSLYFDLRTETIPITVARI